MKASDWLNILANHKLYVQDVSMVINVPGVRPW